MKPPQKAATLHDVATHSGVSYQTVSRVVNNHPSVAEATRNRVLRSIEALKYRPNRAARSLVTNRSDTLAIMSFGSTFYGPAQMLANITQYARSKGYRVSPTTIEQLTRDDVRAALDDLHEHLIDGVILIAPVVSDVMSEVNELAGRIPYIQIDTAPRPGVASIGIEQVYGTQLAVNHLIDLGHRRIAEISGPLNWYDAIMRHRSWVSTMDRHTLRHDMTVEGNWTAESGYNGVLSLLNDGAEFTALVAGNDQMALGAIAALHEHGLNVPDDVSVVGFDDIPESAYFLPALTTVHQDFKLLGEQSIELLISLIRNPEMPIHQRVLYPDLIVRGSTAPAR
ncbi:MAG: lac repressor [Chloroflexota bacterium]|nr:MAG: lac repressor [Chloroflexota bacterium]